LAFDNSLAGSGAVPDVHPLAIEPFVLSMSPQRPFRTRRRNLEVVWTIDELRVVEEWAGDAADALAVFDGYRLTVVDLDPKSPSARTGRLEGVELKAHVVERGLEQLSNRRYGPGRHVVSLGSHYQPQPWPACLPEWLQSPPDHEERGCVEDRAVCARDDADEQRERKTLQRVAAGDEDRHQDADNSEAGDDGPRSRLHNAAGQYMLEGRPLAS